MVPKRWVRQVAKKDGRMAKHGLAISQKKHLFVDLEIEDPNVF